MLPRDALVVAVHHLPTSPRDALAFRLILARYAATALSSIGSRRAGGRYDCVFRRRRTPISRVRN
jgi:hypothetical protein